MRQDGLLSAHFVRTTISAYKMEMDLKVVKICRFGGGGQKKLPSNVGLFGK